MSVRGALTPNQVDTILREGVIGRIGYGGGGVIHIVPVAYAYDGRFIYCYSSDGEKLGMMRENPSVCFEVDLIDDFANWRSVITWGIFEPLEELEALKALEMLSNRMRTVAAAQGGNVDARSFVERDRGFGMAYRIRLLDSSGRFERT